MLRNKAILVSVLVFSFFFAGLVSAGENGGLQLQADGPHEAIVLDLTPPVTTPSLDPATPNGFDDWYLNPVTITLEAVDEEGGSGVAAILYCIHLDPSDICDGKGAWQVLYTEPLVISDSGVIYVSYFAIDNAENYESVKTSTLKIDMELPTGIAVIFDDGAVINTTGNVSAELTVSQDAVSGFSYCEFDWGDGSEALIIESSGVVSKNLPDGEWYTFFQCHDLAGNLENLEATVTVDTTTEETPEPETPIPPASSGGSGGSSSGGRRAPSSPAQGQVLGATIDWATLLPLLEKLARLLATNPAFAAQFSALAN